VVLSLEETDAIGQIQNMGQIADIESCSFSFSSSFAQQKQWKVSLSEIL
jgi:hypothetical protein